MFNQDPATASSKIDFIFNGKNSKGEKFKIQPSLQIIGSNIYTQKDSSVKQNVWIQFNKIEDQKVGIFNFGLKDTNNYKNIITIKIYNFPFINFVWLGVIIMVAGSLWLAYIRKYNSEIKNYV